MWHGELVDTPTMVEAHEFVDKTMEDRLEDMICDVGLQTFAKAVYENMTIDAKTPLYTGSTDFTRLSTILRCINLKAF